jgi:hypothetical protein
MPELNDGKIVGKLEDKIMGHQMTSNVNGVCNGTMFSIIIIINHP